MMTLCDVRLMAGLFMVPGLVVIGCSAMMFCGLLMMLGGLPMMFSALFRHVNPLFRDPGICGWFHP
jgi:hypothetical protein